jgi:hypothetical protein
MHLKCRVLGKMRMYPRASKPHGMPQSPQLIELKSIKNITMELDLIRSKWLLYGHKMNCLLERRPDLS